MRKWLAIVSLSLCVFAYGQEADINHVELPDDVITCGVLDHEVVFNIYVRPLGTTRITYRTAPRASLTGISNANIEKGVDQFVEAMEADFDVDFVKVPDNAGARLYVIQYDVPNNQRGVAIPWGYEGGSYPWPGIYLDPSDPRPWTVDIVKRVTAHEFGHMYGWPHSTDPDDLMHSNTSAKWFTAKELKRWESIFGKKVVPPKPDPPKPDPPKPDPPKPDPPKPDPPKPFPYIDRHNDNLPADVDGDGDVDFKDYRTAAWYYEWTRMGGPDFDWEMQNPMWEKKRPGATDYPDVTGDGRLRNDDLERIVRILLEQN